jgi:hypothetical protein
MSKLTGTGYVMVLVAGHFSAQKFLDEPRIFLCSCILGSFF